MPRRPQHALRLTRRLLGLGYELTPQLFAVLAFAAGALMLASAVTPELDDRLRRLTGVVPPLLIDLSHFAASIAGFLLMLLSAGLWRRRRGASRWCVTGSRNAPTCTRSPSRSMTSARSRASR